MNISKIFELTDEDKAKYQLMIDKIDLSKSSEIINTLNSKLDNLIDLKKLNSIETDLIKNVSVLLNIYQTYPDLTDSIKRRIIFAISYFCQFISIINHHTKRSLKANFRNISIYGNIVYVSSIF